MANVIGTGVATLGFDLVGAGARGVVGHGSAAMLFTLTGKQFNISTVNIAPVATSVTQTNGSTGVSPSTYIADELYFDSGTGPESLTGSILIPPWVMFKWSSTVTVVGARIASSDIDPNDSDSFTTPGDNGVDTAFFYYWQDGYGPPPTNPYLGSDLESGWAPCSPFTFTGNTEVYREYLFECPGTKAILVARMQPYLSVNIWEIEILGIKRYFLSPDYVSSLATTETVRVVHSLQLTSSLDTGDPIAPIRSITAVSNATVIDTAIPKAYFKTTAISKASVFSRARLRTKMTLSSSLALTNAMLPRRATKLVSSLALTNPLLKVIKHIEVSRINGRSQTGQIYTDTATSSLATTNAAPTRYKPAGMVSRLATTNASKLAHGVKATSSMIATSKAFRILVDTETSSLATSNAQKLARSLRVSSLLRVGAKAVVARDIELQSDLNSSSAVRAAVAMRALSSLDASVVSRPAYSQRLTSRMIARSSASRLQKLTLTSSLATTTKAVRLQKLTLSSSLATTTPAIGVRPFKLVSSLDVATQAFRLQQQTETSSLAATAAATRLITLAAQSDLVAFNAVRSILKHTESSNLVLIDVARPIFSYTAVSSVVAVGTAVPLRHVLGLEVSSVALSELAIGRMFAGLTLVSHLDVAAAQSGRALIHATAVSALSARSIAVVPSVFMPLFWSNTISGAGATWDGMPFDSFIEVGGVVYAAGPEGIFQLDPKGNDIDETIESEVRWDLSDFNSRQRKRVRDVLVDGVAEGPFRVRVSGEQGTFEYPTHRQKSDLPMNHRAVVGKGFLSLYYRFAVLQDSYFAANRVTVRMGETSRRI